jgi:hypothetical protein
MKLSAFAIFDTASKLYDPPFVAVQDAVAVRMFANLVNNPDHRYGMNPSDFSLFRVGAWDDNQGHFDPCAPECVYTALQLLKKDESNG